MELDPGTADERIKTRKRDSIEVTGRFELPEGPERHTEATRASAAVKPDETYTLRFEPY